MTNKRLLTLLIPIFVFLLFILFSKFALQHFSPKISPDASKEECLKIAYEYIQKNQPESAIYPLQLVIQKDEDHPQAHFLLACAYYQAQLYPLARKECEKALLLDSQNKKALDLLTQIRFEEGEINWEKKKFGEAISEFIYILNNTQDQKLIDTIANLTGGKYKIKRVTNDLFFDNAPRFSHDGKRIIYHSDTSLKMQNSHYFLEDYGLQKREGEKSRIFVIDLNGGNKTCLSSNEKNGSSERFARFSNDDKKIVYEKENQLPGMDTAFNSNRDIFMKDLDTGKVKRLTNDDTYDGLAGFSPDDKRVLFVSDRHGEGSSVYILNLETGGRKSVPFEKPLVEKIVRRPRGIVLPFCPSFSPNGKKILFHAGYETRKIFLVDENGENLNCLTQGQTDDFFPAFSPDGKKIVFVSNPDDQEDLYLVDVDGSNRIRLTYDGGEKKYPSFSPDGNLIVFAGKQEEQDDSCFEIYLLSLQEIISKEKLIQRLEEMLKIFS